MKKLLLIIDIIKFLIREIGILSMVFIAMPFFFLLMLLEVSLKGIDAEDTNSVKHLKNLNLFLSNEIDLLNKKQKEWRSLTNVTDLNKK